MVDEVKEGEPKASIVNEFSEDILNLECQLSYIKKYSKMYDETDDANEKRALRDLIMGRILNFEYSSGAMRLKLVKGPFWR
jgi:hypothetical protein